MKEILGTAIKWIRGHGFSFFPLSNLLLGHHAYPLPKLLSHSQSLILSEKSRWFCGYELGLVWQEYILVVSTNRTKLVFLFLHTFILISICMNESNQMPHKGWPSMGRRRWLVLIKLPWQGDKLIYLPCHLYNPSPIGTTLGASFCHPPHNFFSHIFNSNPSPI